MIDCYDIRYHLLNFRPDPEHAVIVDEVYTLNDAYMKAKNIQDYVIPVILYSVL